MTSRILLAVFVLALSGCFYGGATTTEPTASQPASGYEPAPPVESRSGPRNPDIEEAQQALYRAEQNPTIATQLPLELERASAPLNEAEAIWKREKGEIKPGDAEWLHIQHLAYIARQRAAIAEARARSLNAGRGQTPAASRPVERRSANPQPQPALSYQERPSAEAMVSYAYSPAPEPAVRVVSEPVAGTPARRQAVAAPAAQRASAPASTAPAYTYAPVPVTRPTPPAQTAVSAASSRQVSRPDSAIAVAAPAAAYSSRTSADSQALTTTSMRPASAGSPKPVTVALNARETAPVRAESKHPSPVQEATVNSDTRLAADEPPPVVEVTHVSLSAKSSVPKPVAPAPASVKTQAAEVSSPVIPPTPKPMPVVAKALPAPAESPKQVTVALNTRETAPVRADLRHPSLAQDTVASTDSRLPAEEPPPVEEVTRVSPPVKTPATRKAVAAPAPVKTKAAEVKSPVKKSVASTAPKQEAPAPAPAQTQVVEAPAPVPAAPVPKDPGPSGPAPKDLPSALGQLEPHSDKRGVVLTFGDDHFVTNGTLLQSSNDAIMDSLVQYLSSHPGLPVVCEGYSDVSPLGGEAQIFAEGRARSVQEALFARGVELRRVRVIGYANTLGHGNRRVDVVIKTSSASPSA